MNTKNDEDIQPLSAEEIKAIGEIELGPAKHEIFLNKHYKKLLWGGIGLGIAAGCVIAYFSHINDMKQDAAAQVIAALKLTAPGEAAQPADYDEATLAQLGEKYASTPSADMGKLLTGMKELAGNRPEAGLATLEALADTSDDLLIKTRALSAIAAHYTSQGQEDKALSAWKRVTEAGDGPYMAHAYIMIGDIARAKGDTETARASYTAAQNKCAPIVIGDETGEQHNVADMRLLLLDVDAPTPVAAPAPAAEDGTAPSPLDMPAPGASPFGDEAPATTEPTPSLDDLIK